MILLMKQHLLLVPALFLLLLPAQIPGQAVEKDISYQDEIVVPLTPQDIPGIIEVPLDKVEPFLSVSVEWDIQGPPGMTNVLQITFSSDANHWEPWIDLYREEHVTKPAPHQVSQLLYANKRTRWVKLRIKPGISAGPWLSNILIHFYSPGATRHQNESESGKPSGETPLNTSNSLKINCPCPHPPYEGRSDWCAIGCPIDPTPVFTNVTHLIIHHSAGSNTANDWAAVVRAIWNYHVNSNGWDDIGYNWLIDPNGVLYEGRPDNYQGAHFCGHNAGTMGVCVMGTYTNVTPTDAALNTLTELLAWKSCQEGIDPEGFSFHSSSGLNLNNISGHRDGCNTECPGDAFYPMLPSVREDVANYIATCPQMAPPLNLTAEEQSAQEVKLQWQDNSFVEDGFLIERSFEDESNYSQIAATGPDVETYTDQVPEAGGYYYRIRAYSATDTSTYSEPAYVLTQPSGIHSISLSANETLRIYPNPLGETQLLHIQQADTYNGSFTLSLLDAYGRRLFTAKGQKTTPLLEEELQLPNMPRGTYLLLLQYEGKTVARSLLVIQ